MAEVPVAECRLCRSTRGVLTREHIPPKSSGNEGPHRIETFRFDSQQPATLDLRDGFALSVLCDTCNSTYGSRLGTSFAGFVQQVQASGRFISPRGGVYAAALDVFPARVYRQLLLNYLCLHPYSEAENWHAIREYVRSRTSLTPPDSLRLGLYCNISNTYRVSPAGSVGALGHGRNPWTGAEIAAPGLGVVYTLGDPSVVNPAIVPRLHDISDWGSARFSERAKVVFELARYRVEVPHPIAYGRPVDVEKWRNRNHIVWLATRFDTDIGADMSAVLWRAAPRRTR